VCAMPPTTGTPPGVEGFLSLPWHPAFVHFPVALLTLAWFVIVARHLTGTTRWPRLGGQLEAIGVAFMPATLATGIRDAQGLDRLFELPWDQPLFWHAIVAVAVVLIFGAHLLWHWRAERRGHVDPRVDLALVTAGFWCLLMTGLIAGEMMFG
jgi:uncharacterized membrane protein